MRTDQQNVFKKTHICSNTELNYIGFNGLIPVSFSCMDHACQHIHIMNSCYTTLENMHSAVYIYIYI